MKDIKTTILDESHPIKGIELTHCLQGANGSWSENRGTSYLESYVEELILITRSQISMKGYEGELDIIKAKTSGNDSTLWLGRWNSGVVQS